MSSTRERVTPEYAHADCGTENFHHTGNNAWYRGLPIPGAPYTTSVIGADAAAWKAENTKEKQDARKAAAAALIQLSRAPVVHATATPAPEVQQPRKSLIMRFKSATATRPASVVRSLMVRLHVPGVRPAAQSTDQDQRDSSNIADAADSAPTTSTSSAPTSTTRTGRFSERLAGIAQRATGRKPSAPSSTSAAPSHGTKRRASQDLDGARTSVQQGDPSAHVGEESSGGGADQASDEGDGDEEMEDVKSAGEDDGKK